MDIDAAKEAKFSPIRGGKEVNLSSSRLSVEYLKERKTPVEHGKVSYLL
jgi:hypothetical protein